MKPFGISHPKTKLMSLVTLLALLFFPLVVLAQSGGGYNLEWNTIDGGGHTFSSGGVYSVGGTLGQPDAGALSGGAYTLSGGFWYGPTAPQAAIRYAAPTAVGSGDCTSWANACTLQTALTGAVSGDEIWVKAGTYTPGSARTDSFRIQRNVQLYGGFAGTETARDQRDWVAHPTILSGDIGTVGNNSDNAYHVVYVDGTTANGPITSATVIDGFTITAGNANGTTWPDYVGGGLYCNGEWSGHECSPTLTNVTFSDNSAQYYGGGMYNYGSSGTSSPTLTNVTFSGNSAFAGGGMYNYGDGGTSSPTLRNVTFSGNSAQHRGGGMLSYGFGGESSPTLTNCILWGNTAPNGPQMYNNSASPTVSYSDIQGGCPSGATCGAGMLYTDPKFVNAAGDNLRLDFGSPAIDKGTNTGCPTTDLDGLPRPTDGDANGTATCDMGAYEAGTMICGVAQGNTYSFPHQSGVGLEITTQGNLACLYVDEMETNHANATTNIQTGRYWLIRGLQGDKQTDATGFSVNLTLPTNFTPDENDKVCRYTGSGQVWDCAADSHMANSITRSGVTAFSDWAVGNNVGPTAIRLRSLVARTSASTPRLGLAAVGMVGLALWAAWRKRTGARMPSRP